MPALEKEAELPEFDIREVINDLDQKLTLDQSVHSFEDLMTGRPEYERCRVFASMLQMANVGRKNIHSLGEIPRVA